MTKVPRHIVNNIFMVPTSCKHTNITKFLIDSGSTISLIPKNNLIPNTPLQTYNQHLYAANNTLIQTYGQLKTQVTINNNKYTWNFIIADIPNPILGADFLAYHKLLIDCHNKTIHHNHIQTNYNHPTMNHNNNINNITSTTHKIITNGYPCKAKTRPLTLDKLDAAKENFKKLLEENIIRPSDSPWSSTLMMTQKKEW